MQVSAKSDVSTGGQISARGTVRLAAPYAADLSIELASVVLRDPQLYATTVNGTMSFKGPVMGGANITGALALGKDRTANSFDGSGWLR